MVDDKIQILVSGYLSVNFSRYALYSKICKDPRHCKVRLLLHKEISERDFSRWSMGVKKLLDIEENEDLLSLLNMLGQANSVCENQLDWFKLALT